MNHVAKSYAIGNSEKKRTPAIKARETISEPTCSTPLEGTPRNIWREKPTGGRLPSRADTTEKKTGTERNARELIDLAQGKGIEANLQRTSHVRQNGRQTHRRKRAQKVKTKKKRRGLGGVSKKNNKKLTARLGRGWEKPDEGTIREEEAVAQKKVESTSNVPENTRTRIKDALPHL